MFCHFIQFGLLFGRVPSHTPLYRVAPFGKNFTVCRLYYTVRDYAPYGSSQSFFEISNEILRIFQTDTESDEPAGDTRIDEFLG